jgi:hypothetical protein
VEDPTNRGIKSGIHQLLSCYLATTWQYENYCLLSYDMFIFRILPWRWQKQAPSKYCYLSKRLHSFTSQKMVTFKFQETPGLNLRKQTKKTEQLFENEWFTIFASLQAMTWKLTGKEGCRTEFVLLLACLHAELSA